MSILRYTASADNTIVNAFQPNMKTRGTGANCGQADILEAYSIYGRQMATSSATSGSQELSRVLLKFDMDKITSDRSTKVIPASGSVKFYLKLFNAKTSKTVPRDFALSILPFLNTSSLSVHFCNLKRKKNISAIEKVAFVQGVR